MAALLASHMGTAAADCPEVDAAAECDSPGDAICELVSSVIICDMTRVGDTTGAEVWAVFNTGAGLCDAGDYCVFGTEGTGEEFCCEYELAATENSLLVIGTAYADTIQLYYDDASAWDMENHTTSLFLGKVLGNGGDDIIYGSRHNNADYQDDLHGDAGVDTFYGQEGADFIAGDAGDDIIHAGPGDDIIFGGDNDVDINGQGGDDTIYGGAGNDDIAGAAGDDTLYGNAGVDDLCGDNENDTLYGGDNEDWLWGGNGTEVRSDGESPTTGSGDRCDSGSSEAQFSCETVSSFSRLADCLVLPGP